MYQRSLRLSSPLPKSAKARAARQARFDLARARGMTVWQASMEIGVRECTGRIYETRRLAAGEGSRR